MSAAVGPELVATCWTTAGDVAPLEQPEISPFPALERVQVAAATGWMGVGFVLDDLRVVRGTIGYDQLRAGIDAAGLRHVEVELGTGWWRTDDDWRPAWAELLDAARQLDASMIKIGTEFGEPATDITPFVEPLRRLGDEAAAIGTRVALEPVPFGAIASIPFGAELVRAASHPAAGLLVDFWHVFRAGTSLPELAACLDADLVFGVELCDARHEVVGSLFEDTRDHRTLVGEGDQDVVGFIRTLREVGFGGPWGVEILALEHRRRPLTEALEVAYATTVATFAQVDLAG